MLSFPLGAGAQEEEAETGIKVGRLRIHPRLGLGYSLDTNLFLQDAADQPGPKAAHRMNLMPALSLGTGANAPVNFQFGAGMEYRLYFSDDPNIRNQSDAAVTSDLAATFNPRGAVAFAILNSFRRQVQAPTQDLPLPFNRDLNKAGAKLAIQPGGGALTFDLYYYFTYEHFENFGFGSAGANSLDNQSHEFLVRGRWKFLPKTAVIAEVQGTFLRWQTVAFNNANMIRAYAGLLGNLTARLTLTARVGYGNSLHVSGPRFSKPVGDVEVAYLITPAATARLGYAFDFFVSPWGNYFENHRVGASIDAVLLRRFDLAVNVAYHRLDFAANPDPTLLSGGGAMLLTNDARADNLVVAGASFGVRIKRWMTFTAGYSLEYRTSNNGLSFTGVSGRVVDRFDYVRHLITSAVGFQY